MRPSKYTPSRTVYSKRYVPPTQFGDHAEAATDDVEYPDIVTPVGADTFNDSTESEMNPPALNARSTYLEHVFVLSYVLFAVVR